MKERYMVQGGGADRVKAEAARLADIKARSVVPEACGPEIPAAPARGAFMAFEPRVVVPGGRTVKDGHCGRRAVMLLDAFDVMEAQARRKAPNAAPLFSRGQVHVGRLYAVLHERLSRLGISGVSLEVQAARRGGGGSGGHMEAVIADRARLDGLRGAVGTGVALVPSRQHMDRGRVPKAIEDARLVDLVCLEGKTLTDVLERHGWTARGETRKRLRVALCAALDRMRKVEGC
jgi:hypothetical protein